MTTDQLESRARRRFTFGTAAVAFVFLCGFAAGYAANDVEREMAKRVSIQRESEWRSP